MRILSNRSTPTDDNTPRYLLAICSFQPLYGRLCNVLGRKRANQTALFFQGLGVLMCGLSTNMEMLIVARFVRLYVHANVKKLNSCSFPALVVVAYSLQHRKRQKSHLLRNLMTLFSIIVSDMYSLRVSIAVLRMR